MTNTPQDETISEKEWARAQRLDCGRIWDGYHYVKRFHPVTLEIYWQPVNVKHPLIRRERRE